MARVLIVALLMSLTMTAISAYIRLSDAGLGCDAWPTCYTNQIWVDSEPGISIREDDSNQGLRVIHRFTASAFGLLVLILMVVSLWYRKSNPAGVLESVLAFLLTFILAVVGMNTPNVETPLVSFTNIAGGMLLSAILYLWIQKLRQPKLHFWRGNPILIVSVLSVILAIMSGAWVSSNFAALACESAFQCSGLSDASFSQAFSFTRHLEISNGQLLADGHASLIGFVHHFLALVMVLVFAYFAYLKMKAGDAVLSLGMPIIIGCILIIQGFSGWVVGPLSIAVSHNVLSVILLLSVLSLFKVESSDA